jgi:hypothetical protein
MACIYSRGQEGKFSDLLDYFGGCEIESVECSGKIVHVKYWLNGERRYLATTPHCLLAACTLVQPFFKNPLESLSGLGTSHKTPL